MAIEKTLLLKGLVGVAAIGGVGGGVVIAHKSGAFKSKKERADDAKGNLGDEENKKAKKEEINKRLTTLGLESCHLSDGEVTSSTTFSKECELTKEQFQTINFSNKPEAGNVTVEGWTSNNTVTLKIENKPGDENGIKFTFKEIKDKLTITGGNSQGTITLRPGAKEFEESNNKLTKKVDSTLSGRLKGYNSKFQTLSLPEDCRFDDTEEDTTLECEVTEEKLKQIKFSNGGESDIGLSGLNSGEKIKLKIEEKEDQSGIKYIFKNEKSNGITLTGTTGDQKKMVLKANKETEFEKKGEKLSKIISNQTTYTKLKKHNEKLETLKLPGECRFDVAEEDTTFECDVTKDNIKSIKFSNKETGDLTIAEGDNFSGLKLNVSESGDNLKFIFKGGDKKIKLSSGNKHIFIKNGEDNEFEFKNDALHKIPKKVNELAEKVKLVCKYGDSGDGGTCEFTDNFINLFREDGASSEGIRFSNGEEKNLKFEFSEEGGGFVFTYKGETKGTGVKLEQNVKYEVKTLNGVDCLSKKNPQQ